MKGKRLTAEGTEKALRAAEKKFYE